MADAAVSKTAGRKARVGSTPTFGTNSQVRELTIREKEDAVNCLGTHAIGAELGPSFHRSPGQTLADPGRLLGRTTILRFAGPTS